MESGWAPKNSRHENEPLNKNNKTESEATNLLLKRCLAKRYIDNKSRKKDKALGEVFLW